MDKKKSILNISVAVALNGVTMVMAIWIKRLVIQCCGNEVNGLNSLYASIIGTLSIAELGVGTAISFCMYRPIAEGNKKKVAALYNLFFTSYLLIGGIILLAGMLLLPNMRFFAKDYTRIDENLYITFFLCLVTVVVTYFYGAKTALINAHKCNYITTVISSGGIILQYLMQAAVLYSTGSFMGFLLCKLIVAIIQWIITEIIARRLYSDIVFHREILDKQSKKEVYTRIQAMFIHKVGGILVNSVDSIVISSFIGVAVLGKYSNYAAIMGYMVAILNIVFSSMTSIIGHYYVINREKETKIAFEFFHLVGFLLGLVFFCGYCAIVDNLITILFGGELKIARSLSIVITTNGFVQFMRRAVLTFRDATGTFYYDRWKPLAEGLANLFLSVIFVNQLGVSGVILATIITNLLLCHIVEPFVLYKYAFKESPRRYFLRNYSMMLVFVLVVVFLHFCMYQCENEWTELLINGTISVCISAVICAAVIVCHRNLIKQGLQIIKGENHDPID